MDAKSQPVSFDQAKPAIEHFLTVERRREFAQKELKSLRAAAKVEYIGKFAEKAASDATAAASSATTADPASAATDAQAASSAMDSNALNKGLSGLK